MRQAWNPEQEWMKHPGYWGRGSSEAALHPRPQPAAERAPPTEGPWQGLRQGYLKWPCRMGCIWTEVEVGWREGDTDPAEAKEHEVGMA